MLSHELKEAVLRDINNGEIPFYKILTRLNSDIVNQRYCETEYAFTFYLNEELSSKEFDELLYYLTSDPFNSRKLMQYPSFKYKLMGGFYDDSIAHFGEYGYKIWIIQVQ